MKPELEKLKQWYNKQNTLQLEHQAEVWNLYEGVDKAIQLLDIGGCVSTVYAGKCWLLAEDVHKVIALVKKALKCK